MKRGRQLVALALQKTTSNLIENTNGVTSSEAISEQKDLIQPEDNRTTSNLIENTNGVTSSEAISEQKDLIQPEDLGFKLTLPTPSFDLDVDLIEDLYGTLSRSTNTAIKITDFNNEDSHIDNSQEVHYTELQSPFKRIKYGSPTTIQSSFTINNGSVIPGITINESLCSSESESNAVFGRFSANTVSNNNIQQTDNFRGFDISSSVITSQHSDPDPGPSNIALNRAVASTAIQNPTITPSNIMQKKRKQRKEQTKFPNYTSEEKISRNREKHPMISDHCGFKCHRQCEHFDISKRSELWDCYWKLDHDHQIKWLARYVKLLPIQTKRNRMDTENLKNNTRAYFLPFNNGTEKQVCKTFFLNTYGYKNDSIITTICKKLKEADTTISLSDKRGTNPKPRIDCTLIEQFVTMYKPCTAHYRRHNAPNVMYLAQDLTLEKLFNDFREMHPDFKCCKEILRRYLKENNISLHRPQSDKCFDCLSFETNIAENMKNNTVTSLKLLCQKICHQYKAKQATDFYKNDAERERRNTEKIYSMDLQKSVLLPMMPEVKDCFFTNRMISFNLTFCGLIKNRTEGSKCLVWNEAIGGRDGKDIIDAFYKFILSERDTKKFIFWPDNCCAQNKNWISFTAIVTIMNTHDIESITIKYLTKGHTHMSADGVHGNIEKNFKKIKNIYDFEDYKQCIETSLKSCQVIEVTLDDKYCWEKKKKVKMAPIMLADIVEVKFEKNKRIFQYKKNFNDSYSDLDFLQTRFKADQLPKKIQKVRGIRSSKKKEILEKLVQLMPANRRLFWQDLPANDNSDDLISSGAYSGGS